jgi:molybdopterin converting factor small subunit
MSIEVELFGQLLPGVQRRQIIHLEGSASAQEIANELGLNPDEVGLITIDGVQSEMDALVNPGCRICFFPYMSGG